MSAPDNRAPFELSIRDVTVDFKVLAFRGSEALNTLYNFTVQLVSPREVDDLDSLLHKPAYLQMTRQGIGIHGLIDLVAESDQDSGLMHYTLTLRPQLAYLSHRFNHRIFQHQTVEQIIRAVLADHGITDTCRFHLRGSYPPREYCVQYGESDLHFVQRLCEEEGLHFHFEHSPQTHHLVFGDDQTSFPKLPDALAYRRGNDLVAETPKVSHFKTRMETRTSLIERRDYDFEQPHFDLKREARSTALPVLEDYRYPGHYKERSRGSQLSLRALERHRHDYILAEGRSNEAQLVSGHIVELTEHPNSRSNGTWLLTEVRHEGRQPQVLRGQADARNEPVEGYRNQFFATPAHTPFRPRVTQPKPRIFGSQTAVVTGPTGEEIHCDNLGRVKVQFHWDREGSKDEASSCWLRVASSWAGNNYGSVVIPRVGMEVLVTFLEGDPDQPLISGCLYHAEQRPPYPPTDHKTRSVFKSLSSPGGGGSNELRIDDMKGAEQIFVHAQRDWEENIEHDQKIRVGHERHDRVEANSFSAFMAEEHRVTESSRLSEVRGDDHLTVGQAIHISVGTDQLLQAGREIHLSAGEQVVIDGGMELTLTAGGSFIKIDPGGITLSGPMIKMNSGGAPSRGTPAAPLLPDGPAPAKTGEPGKPLIPAQAATIRRTPRCEPCEKAAREAGK